MFFHSFYTVYGWLFPKAEPVKQYRLGKAWLYALNRIKGIEDTPLETARIQYLLHDLHSRGASPYSGIFEEVNSIISGANAAIDAITMNVIVRGLSANSLKKIHLQTETITDAAMLIFAKFLEHNQSVEEISIGRFSRYNDRLLKTVRISESAMKTLVTSLNKNTHINSLHLNFCALSDIAWPCVIDLLRKNRVIQEIVLTGNVLTAKTAQELMSVIKERSLKILDLSECELDDAAIKVIADNLANGAQIEKIVIQNVAMTEYGLETIASSLTSNKFCVKDLDISKISASKAGLAAILSALENNKTLNSISLPKSNVGIDAATRLAQHSTLKRLILDCRFTDLQTIANVTLHPKCRVEHLELYGVSGYYKELIKFIAENYENFCLATLKIPTPTTALAKYLKKYDDEQVLEAKNLVNAHRKNMFYCYSTLKHQVGKMLPTETVEKIASYANMAPNFRQPFKILYS